MSAVRPEQSMVRGSAPLQRSAQKNNSLGPWSIVGGAALMLLAAAVIINLPDIKRYIKISTM